MSVTESTTTQETALEHARRVLVRAENEKDPATRADLLGVSAAWLAIHRAERGL